METAPLYGCSSVICGGEGVVRGECGEGVVKRRSQEEKMLGGCGACTGGGDTIQGEEGERRHCTGGGGGGDTVQGEEGGGDTYCHSNVLYGNQISGKS